MILLNIIINSTQYFYLFIYFLYTLINLLHFTAPISLKAIKQMRKFLIKFHIKTIDQSPMNDLNNYDS